MTMPREDDYTKEVRVSNIFNTNTINLIKDKNILDLGTHKGHLANIALSYGAKSIIGIDNHIENCDSGKLIHPEVSFINLNLDENSYLEFVEKSDVIFCFGISYYVSNFSEMFKNISSFSNIKTVVVETAFIEEDIVTDLYNLLSEKTLTDIFINNNFNILEMKKYTFDTDYPYMSDRVVYVLTKDLI